MDVSSERGTGESSQCEARIQSLVEQLHDPTLVREFETDEVIRDGLSHNPASSISLPSYLDLRQTQNNLWTEERLHEGIQFAKLGKLKEAEKCYREGLDSDPRHVDLLVAYGALLANQGREVEGIGKLQEALSIDPGCPNAQSYLGAVQKKLEQKKKGQQKSQPISFRADKAMLDAMAEKAFLEGGAGVTTGDGDYPILESDGGGDDDDNHHRKKKSKRKEKRTKKKKKKKKKRRRHKYNSSSSDSELESSGDERPSRRKDGQRRKRHRKRSPDSHNPSSSGRTNDKSKE